MTKTPDEIKKGLEFCSRLTCGEKNVDCPYECGNSECISHLTADALALIQQLEDHLREATKKVKQIEVERDAMKEALGLMVYQYCVRGDKLDHLYMCAGETAFRVLGLEQYGDTRTLESWLFPECQDKEE